MPTISFDDHLRQVKKNPEAKKEIEEEEMLLDASVALMKAREQAGLTQEQLAERTHVSRITISRIEQGQVSPSLRTLNKLAGAMGKTLNVEFV